MAVSLGPFASSSWRVVDIGQLVVSRAPRELLVTHALGSCVGVTFFDPHVRVGALLHAMLPRAANFERGGRDPAAFVDAGIELALERCVAQGAARDRLVVTLAGGARIAHGGAQGSDHFAVGQRNVWEARRTLERLGVPIAGTSTGGVEPRNMSLALADGAVEVRTNSGRTFYL